MLSDNVIEMKNIIKSFYIGTENQLDILKGIDIDVKNGEFLSIVGASGSGKSTLMNIIGALDRPTSGEYFLDGSNINELSDDELSDIRNKRIGFVFQTFNLIPRSTALKNVELPMLYAGIDKKKRIEKAKELLELVDMGERMTHLPNELSGGQKQRVLISRALAKKPEILILDDSSSALDYKTDSLLRKAINDNFKDTTTIIVAQRISSIKNADKIIVLEEGKIIGYGNHDELIKDCYVYKEISDSQMGGDIGEN